MCHYMKFYLLCFIAITANAARPNGYRSEDFKLVKRFPEGYDFKYVRPRKSETDSFLQKKSQGRGLVFMGPRVTEREFVQEGLSRGMESGKEEVKPIENSAPVETAFEDNSSTVGDTLEDQGVDHFIDEQEADDNELIDNNDYESNFNDNDYEKEGRKDEMDTDHDILNEAGENLEDFEEPEEGESKLDKNLFFFSKCSHMKCSKIGFDGFGCDGSLCKFACSESECYERLDGSNDKDDIETVKWYEEEEEKEEEKEETKEMEDEAEERKKEQEEKRKEEEEEEKKREEEEEKKRKEGEEKKREEEEEKKRKEEEEKKRKEEEEKKRKEEEDKKKKEEEKKKEKNEGKKRKEEEKTKKKEDNANETRGTKRKDRSKKKRE